MQIKNKNLQQLDGSMVNVGIVFSKYNEKIGSVLLKNTIEELSKYNVKPKNIKVFEVPGALEIPFATKKIIKTNRLDVVIALGIIIKGKTAHFEHVSRESINKLVDVSLEMNVPVITGILTTLTRKQAQERAKHNPSEYANAAIYMALNYN